MALKYQELYEILTLTTLINANKMSWLFHFYANVYVDDYIYSQAQGVAKAKFISGSTHRSFPLPVLMAVTFTLKDRVSFYSLHISREYSLLFYTGVHLRIFLLTPKY